MELPFSHDEFLDVFGAYNTALWPAVVVLWAVTASLGLRWLRTGRADARAVYALLALHWAWSGLAYHWFFFRGINPAATLFAAVFVAQTGIFTWLAWSSSGSVSVSRGVRGIVGGALVCYGLAYPFVNVALGLQYPRAPLFAVPCPTTLVTAGLLLITAGTPRWVNIVPILWAVTASSAAFALGIRADLALVPAAALLALDALWPSALGARVAVAAGNRGVAS